MTLLSPDADGLAVMQMAAEVEHRTDEVELWYARTKIHELDDLTAETLVSMGRTQSVIQFLCAIRDGSRG
jgi:hypothetical protein